jgi:hypothetical protein
MPTVLAETFTYRAPFFRRSVTLTECPVAVGSRIPLAVTDLEPRTTRRVIAVVIRSSFVIGP